MNSTDNRYFISYRKSTDSELAHNLGDYLTRQRIHTFVDIHDLNPGENWRQGLKSNIDRSEYMVALFTEGYVAQIEKDNDVIANVILQELQWAIADRKLIPIVIGLEIGDVISRCRQNFPALADLHCLRVEMNEQFTVREISIALQEQRFRSSSRNQLSNQNSPDSSPQPSSVFSSGTQIEPATYDFFDQPWDTEQALALKKSLEDKDLLKRNSLENTLLAQFYLSGRFGIVMDPDKAFSLLMAAQLKPCPEAHFELGRMYEFGTYASMYDDDKAISLYRKADAMGFYPATLRLASLLEDKNNVERHAELSKMLQDIEHDYALPKVFDEPYDYLWQRGIELAQKDEDNPAKSLYWQATAELRQNQNHQTANAILKLAVEHQSLRAKADLAWYMLYDENFETDYQQAAALLLSAEEHGSVFARERLAALHCKKTFELDEHVFVQDKDFAIQKLKQNIAIGYWDSCYILAFEMHEALKPYRDDDFLRSALQKASKAGHNDCRAELAYWQEFEWKEPSAALINYKLASQSTSIRTSLVDYSLWRQAKMLLASDSFGSTELQQAKVAAFKAYTMGEERAAETLAITAALEGKRALAERWFDVAGTEASKLQSLLSSWSKKQFPQAQIFREVLLSKDDPSSVINECLIWLDYFKLRPFEVEGLKNYAPSGFGVPSSRYAQGLVYCKRLQKLDSPWREDLTEAGNKQVAFITLRAKAAEIYLEIESAVSQGGCSASKANALVIQLDSINAIYNRYTFADAVQRHRLYDAFESGDWGKNWVSMYYLYNFGPMNALTESIKKQDGQGEVLWPERAPSLLWWSIHQWDKFSKYVECADTVVRLLISSIDHKNTDMFYRQTVFAAYLKLVTSFTVDDLVTKFNLCKADELKGFMQRVLAVYDEPPQGWDLIALASQTPIVKEALKQLRERLSTLG